MCELEAHSHEGSKLVVHTIGTAAVRIPRPRFDGFLSDSDSVDSALAELMDTAAEGKWQVVAHESDSSTAGEEVDGLDSSTADDLEEAGTNVRSL